MACCGGGAGTDKRTREIDEDLKAFQKGIASQVKLLLLGAGESGKSTIFKQMKIIQNDGGYKDEELETFKFIIFGNCISQMKVIVNAAAKLGVEIENPDNKKRAERLAELPSAGDSWNGEVAEAVKALWADKDIQSTYQMRDKHYQLNDSAVYFFENVDRFAKDDYLPSQDDVLRARVRSTGIEEAFFTFDDISFRMVDVGGQRSERRKWIHCFDCVTAVLFVSSLSEYDQTLREDDTQNRMKESLLLFDEICNSPWFRDTSIILFLNKTDLFKEKIERVSLSVCFPNYAGKNNYEEASDFIKQRFLEQNTSSHVVYCHFTCAVNTDNIEVVFRSVRETLLKECLGQAGIL